MPNNPQLRHKIIVLHYIYQLSLNKLSMLFQETNELANFETTHPEKIARILNVSLDRAMQIQLAFSRYLELPIEQMLSGNEIKVVLYMDVHYPQSLLNLYDPPTALYIKGNPSLINRRNVAIIGSRRATEYSKRALRFIVPPLVENKITVISGMAKGADTMAHFETIALGGKTAAVIGSGFDNIYPRENKRLFEELSATQCVLSEFPPYVEPRKWHFPMRNRIISALSDALVVTQASDKSGTLITTDYALDLGKTIFAVPGPIDQQESFGTNKLIKDGAIPVWNGYQIVEEMSLFRSKI
jgi:DNA processing protein